MRATHKYASRLQRRALALVAGAACLLPAALPPVVLPAVAGLIAPTAALVPFGCGVLVLRLLLMLNLHRLNSYLRQPALQDSCQ